MPTLRMILAVRGPSLHPAPSLPPNPKLRTTLRTAIRMISAVRTENWLSILTCRLNRGQNLGDVPASTLRFSVSCQSFCNHLITRPIGWSRYGEDPTLIQMIGVAAMRGLQNPQPVPGGKPEDVFFATRQVTRHYIAYHGASPDIKGEILPGARSTFCIPQPWRAIGRLERCSS